MYTDASGRCVDPIVLGNLSGRFVLANLNGRPTGQNRTYSRSSNLINQNSNNPLNAVRPPCTAYIVGTTKVRQYPAIPPQHDNVVDQLEATNLVDITGYTENRLKPINTKRGTSITAEERWFQVKYNLSGQGSPLVYGWVRADRLRLSQSCIGFGQTQGVAPGDLGYSRGITQDDLGYLFGTYGVELVGAESRTFGTNANGTDHPAVDLKPAGSINPAGSPVYSLCSGLIDYPGKLDFSGSLQHRRVQVRCDGQSIDILYSHVCVDSRFSNSLVTGNPITTIRRGERIGTIAGLAGTGDGSCQETYSDYFGTAHVHVEVNIPSSNGDELHPSSVIRECQDNPNDPRNSWCTVNLPAG
jgi:hypothetical protein